MLFNSGDTYKVHQAVYRTLEDGILHRQNKSAQQPEPLFAAVPHSPCTNIAPIFKSTALKVPVVGQLVGQVAEGRGDLCHTLSGHGVAEIDGSTDVGVDLEVAGDEREG